jgi:hypothetical protein
MEWMGFLPLFSKESDIFYTFLFQYFNWIPLILLSQEMIIENRDLSKI